MIQNLKLFLKSVILILNLNAFSQENKTICVNFIPLFNNKPLSLGQDYYSNSEKENITFSVFKFYATHFEFYKNGKLVHSLKNSSFLIDVAETKSLKRNLVVPNNCDFDELKFYLGIEDAVNYNGIGSGDLDPSKDMYWAWQSGYINLKLEGKCKVISSNGNAFQFHLGGFLDSFSCFQTISLKTINNSNNINIYTDIDLLLEKISLKSISTIMSPGQNAVMLSKKASSIFHL
jgi:hypothetical protein